MNFNHSWGMGSILFRICKNSTANYFCFFSEHWGLVMILVPCEFASLWWDLQHFLFLFHIYLPSFLFENNKERLWWWVTKVLSIRLEIQQVHHRLLLKNKVKSFSGVLFKQIQWSYSIGICFLFLNGESPLVIRSVINSSKKNRLQYKINTFS